MKTKILLALVGSLLFGNSLLHAQSGPATWIELGFSKKIVNNLKFEFNPELRLWKGFDMDTYILEGGLSYKFNKYLTIAGYYRYENEWDYKKSTGEFKGKVASNRIAFDAKSGFGINRFDVQFRVRYTNGEDFDSTTDDKASFFRYRAKIDYDLRSCKLIPYVSAEAFHDLIEKEISKMRYTCGLSYPITKNSEISLFYRLQNYKEAGKANLDIFGIGYDFKF